MGLFNSFTDRPIFGKALYPLLPIGQTFPPDADAINFINIVGITDSTQQQAITSLVYDLKINNLWDKMKAIYPIVGGTSSTHKWNLKDPRDLDNAFRLNFVGGWTHSTNGALPNGTNGYADTFLRGDLTAQNSTHLSYYSRSNTAGGVGILKVEMGLLKLSPSTISTNVVLLRDNVTIGAVNSATLTTTGLIANTQGFYVSNRISSTSMTLHKNGSLQITSNDNSVTPSTINIWIGARNSPDNTGAANYTDRQCAFASIGDGLNSNDQINFYNIVQNYQTILGRQV